MGEIKQRDPNISKWRPVEDEAWQLHQPELQSIGS